MTSTDCLPCSLTAQLPSLPPREAVWVDEHWRVALSFDSALPGWLVVLPLRHLTAVAELSDDESAVLGRVLRDASASLHAVVGCVKTYVIQFAEKEGFGHVHFHVVPRMADQPEDRRGPRIFGYLDGGAPPESARDELALQLRAAWS